MAGQTGFSELKEEPECLDNCFSIQHASQICAIASAATGIDAVPLWAKCCANYSHSVDEFGRTALHVVASTGNVEALEWLIKRAGANIDKKDKMSGHTALHRSIYFGNLHVARSLMKFNADLNQRDNEGMTAFELCNKEIKDFLQKDFHAKLQSDPTELLAWGSNDNYTLGNINKQERLVPEQLEVFRKNNTQIMKVVMSTYHSLFLSQLGDIFVCGSGRLGILGNGYDKPVLQPEPLHIRSVAKCISIAAGADHTLFLMENGRVLSCGSNEFGISGQKESVKQLLVPKTVEIPGKVSIEGIIAARYHSIFYTSRRLYTCGLHRGQLGHSKDYKEQALFEPKLVSQIAWDDDGETKFTHFAASTCATVARASTGIIYVITKFEVIKINAKQFDVVKLQVTGGAFSESNIDKSAAKLPIGNNNDEHLIVLLLTSTGRIIVWRTQVAGSQTGGSGGTFSRVIFNSGRVLDVSDVFLSQSCLLFVTACGEAYKSVWKPLSEPSYGSLPSWERQRQRDAQQLSDFQISTGSRRPQKGKDPSANVSFLEHMKIQKIKHVYSALCITADEQGKNFAIIQSSPKTQLTCLPAVSASQLHLDMLKFLDETSEDDTLHDVVLQVGKRRFPAHMYIIASGCPKLHSIIVSKLKRTQGCGDGQKRVTPIEDVDEQVFEQILKFVYSHTSDLLTVGQPTHANIKVPDIIKSTMEAARRLELENYCKALRKFVIVDGVVCARPLERPFEISCRRFARNVNEDLSDITLQSRDSRLYKAHRCVLVPRSEYFYSMLYANLWLEHSSTKPVQLQFSAESLEVFLDYVYEDAISNLPSNDFDLLAEILVMSDNLFLERLRNLVEAALAELLSLKNITSMLYLADRCNATQLKETCMQFIVMNLALILETRLLDPLPLDLVKELSSYYRQTHPFLPSRRIQRPENAPDPMEFEQGMLNLSPDLANEIETLSLDDEVLARKSLSKSTKNIRKRIRSRLSEGDHNTVEVMNNNSSPVNLRNSLEDLGAFPSASPQTSSTRPCSLSEEFSEAEKITRVSQSFQRKLNFPNPSQTMTNLRNAEADEALKIRQKLNASDFPSLNCVENNNNKSSASSEVWTPLPTKQQQVLNFASRSIQKPLSEVANKSSSLTAAIPMPVIPQTENTIVANCAYSPKQHGGGKKKTKWKSVDLNNVSNSKDQSPLPVTPQPSSAPSRDPKNPWKIDDARKKVAFREIVQDEVEKKENFQRATTKPLNLMQIEDHAINQLTARYHSKDVEDGIEIVTVERVEERNFAPPTWVQHSPFSRNN